MPGFNSVMIGTTRPRDLAEFYERVFGRPADLTEDTWCGWQVGSTHFMIGEHSEVKKEFEKIKALGAEATREPYEMESTWIATFSDPDGNYFRLMSPRTVLGSSNIKAEAP